MKKIFLLIMVFGYNLSYAGSIDTSLIGSNTSPEKIMKDKILDDIRQNLEIKNKTYDSTIIKLDTRISRLDSTIKITGNPKERIDKLVERVQILEEKQKAQEENELNTYEANYQSAIINLVSMDREIKPLVLFQTTKDFFDALTETSNPMTYDGYNEAFNKFREYAERHKDHDVMYKAISDIFSVSGGMAFHVPVTGAFAGITISGMAQYINNIGARKREVKRNAEKMFAVTTKLSMFNNDKNMIESEWDVITESLNRMQGNYDTVLKYNLAMINTNKNDFISAFAKESDANKRYQYLTDLREKATAYVLKTKQASPKSWKENIYYQLIDVQILKMKYGDITYGIRKHIDKYDELISKYKSDKEIGGHVVKLDQKLNRLKETFDSTFEPEEYAHTASRMYKVM